MVVILVVAMVICNIACTSSQMEGFKKKSKMSKLKSKPKPKPSESESSAGGGGDDSDGGDDSGAGVGKSGEGAESSGGTEKTDTTLSQNIATILSDVQRIKKELTS
jgi:hypothetical protein